MRIVNRRECRDGKMGRESAQHIRQARSPFQLGYWRRCIARLRENWTAFTKDIVRAIAEEEMKISREEFDQEIGARRRR